MEDEDTLEQELRAYLLKGYSINEIKYYMHHTYEITDDEFKVIFKRVVKNLEHDPNLLKCLRDRDDIVVGKIEINKRGTGYVKFGSKKVVIDMEELNNALDGDLVLVTGRDVGKSRLYTVEDIIERKDGLIVVNYVDGRFVPLNVPFNYEIELSDEDKSKIKPNDRLQVKVNDVRDGKVTATLQEVIGHKDDPVLGEKTILAEHKFHTTFSETYKKEEAALPDGVVDSDFKTHFDMRRDIAFTIDDIDTQDIDDGLFLRLLSNGEMVVGIPLSHISYYVDIHSAIFKEASERATSVYIGRHSEPMFGRKLCNGIGSLWPNEDRLARTILVKFDAQFNIVDFNIVNSVIRSRKKMTYDDVDKILVNDSVPEGYDKYRNTLLKLNEISDDLERRKDHRGAISFYGNDVKTIYNTMMNPIGFKRIKDSPGRKLIENFALLANELYDYYCFERGIRNINRVEGSPNPEKLEKLINCLNACGFNFDDIHNVDSTLELKRIVEILRHTDKFPVYSGLIVRNIQKAFYTTEEIGHWALLLLYYAHFTSPIRRFPDFINHKIMDYEMEDKPLPFTIEELEEFAAKASERERAADAASIEKLKIDMAEYMSNYIGQQFKGTITDISSFGLTVKTDGEVVGNVSPRSIRYGSFKHNSEMYCYYDPKSQKEYHIGDDVIVTVKDADPKHETIDFYLDGHYERSSVKKKTHNNKYKRR